MNVNEIFTSIQGEGPNMGVPSIFIRLSGCNLRCVFCDTKYTWLFSNKTLIKLQETVPSELLQKLGDKVYSKEEETHQTDIEDIVSKILDSKVKNVVITGGEPLLQKDEVKSLISNPKLEGFSFEIETNGTLPPVEFDDNLFGITLRYNVSPKLANSYNNYEERIKPKILNDFLSKNSIFKFVISQESDLSEVVEIAETLNLSKSKTYLMPEATNQKEILERGKMVAELSMLHGFNYSHRLHVEFYGDQRGV